MQYAGFWRRFFAFFIDQAVLTLLVMVIGIAVAFALGFAGVTTSGPDNPLDIIIPVIAWVIVFFYFAGLEASEAQGTIGKGLLKIKVTDLEGNRISFRRSTMRTLGKAVSYWIILIGFIMAAFTKRKQTLHDMMAKCLVVKVS